METSFELVVVAFLRGVGGRVRVLLTIDRDGAPLFDGEPALLVEHRPGMPSVELSIDGADGITDESLELVRSLAHERLARIIDEAFDASGEFDAERLLGRGVMVDAAHDCFDPM